MNIQFTGGELVTIYNGHPAAPPKITPPRQIIVPHRGGQPKPIGQLLRPIEQIARHPDRNRLMAEFCKLINF